MSTWFGFRPALEAVGEEEDTPPEVVVVVVGLVPA